MINLINNRRPQMVSLFELEQGCAYESGDGVIIIKTDEDYIVELPLCLLYKIEDMDDGMMYNRVILEMNAS